MRILHTYCLNYNIGDYALGIGLKALLRNNLDVSLIAETNLQGTVFDEYFISEVVNKKYDLLVIGGGGIIHGAHWPNGWFWLIEKELIRKIKIPFIVYGVGYNYFKGEEGIPERGIVHLKETIANAAYFSVRNDGSVERLKDQTGIIAPEIPDPGFHVSLNACYERPISEPYVVIQLANDKPEYRFGAKENKDIFIRKMRSVVENLSKKYKVILAPHVFDDILLSTEVSLGINNCEVWNFGYYAFDHSDKALAFYKYAHFVLAMRGHGQIVPIGFNTPVISLENHEKNRGLMEKIGLMEYNVDILNEDFGLKINDAVKKIEDNRVRLVGEYHNINSMFFVESLTAFETIKNAIHYVK
jgi:polysaccharide pyruvyl transferase WcaK-like protein